MLVVRHGTSLRKDESQFQIIENYQDDEVNQRVTVHPWRRGEDSSVYISVGVFTPDGEEAWDEVEGEPAWNIIVDREEFVRGLLEVFPELRRA